MATSFFGRIEPEGRRLGSDLFLVGKWVESYPQRISSSAVPVARLSPADQETLFSKTKCEFRIFEQSDKTVKLEAVPRPNVLHPPNWDDFRKIADPEVVAMMSHPNYGELVRRHEQLDELVDDCEPEAGQIYCNAYKYALNAGCDTKTADAYAQKAANDFVDSAGIALQRIWREEQRARLLGSATSLDASRQFGKPVRSRKTAQEIEAAMIQAIKESNHKQNPATPASRKKDLKIDPRATAPVKDHQFPTPTTSPAHGSDTSARSARSFLSESPPSSSSTLSPTLLLKPAITILKRPQPTSETKATTSPSPLASVNTPNSAVPLETMGHPAGYAYVASSGPFMGTQPMFSPGTLVPIPSSYPFIYAGNVHYGPYANGPTMPNYTNTWVSPATPIAADLKENHIDSSRTVAKQPKGSGKTGTDTLLQRLENQYQVAKSQPYSSTTCYEVEHPLPSTGEIRPAYWLTKEGKARLLHEKLSRLRAKDREVQREYMSRTNAPLSNTVHIFVDLSNIVIGFYDTMKTSRGFPLQKRVKVPFSFKNFDSILTRGRKVEKRVVAGSVREHSHKRPEYMTDAADLDYEMCILTRVPKPDSKPKKYGRRSEVSADQFESRGEQCVDEVLHLKILQSALDVPHPGTMVLATGDAACAEYSDGFKMNAERALAKGWKIELYAWKNNIARDWRDPEFTSRWGSRFRIIELDEFCEELLDLTVESVDKAQ